jgi:YteA family regulatory protein
MLRLKRPPSRRGRGAAAGGERALDDGDGGDGWRGAGDGAGSGAAAGADGAPPAARRRLRQRRAELRRLQRGLARGGGLQASQGEALAELSTYDNHPADIGTETWQRGQAVGLAQDCAHDLAAVADAEERLRRGTYGRCAACGQPIPAERLALLPEALYCTRCQSALEAGRSWQGKPAPTRAEEQVLSPPFGRSDRDGADATGFDGEDAWQALARFGSSNTAADVGGDPSDPEAVEDADERRGAVEGVDQLLDGDGNPVDPAGDGVP